MEIAGKRVHRLLPPIVYDSVRPLPKSRVAGRSLFIGEADQCDATAPRRRGAETRVCGRFVRGVRRAVRERTPRTIAKRGRSRFYCFVEDQAALIVRCCPFQRTRWDRNRTVPTGRMVLPLAAPGTMDFLLVRELMAEDLRSTIDIDRLSMGQPEHHVAPIHRLSGLAARLLPGTQIWTASPREPAVGSALPLSEDSDDAATPGQKTLMRFACGRSS